ncbi:MAG: hypothetical protein ACR2OZ_09605 [Verrucomicrobiales bacterium]
MIDEAPAPVEITDVAFDADNRSLRMSWTSAFGQAVELESSGDLAEWTSQGMFSTGCANPRGVTTSTDPSAATEMTAPISFTDDQRFFRLRALTLTP